MGQYSRCVITLRTSLAGMLLAISMMAIAATPVLSGTTLENCKWDGSGPVCDGVCTGDKVVAKRSKKGCILGQKVLCCDEMGTSTQIYIGPPKKKVPNSVTTKFIRSMDAKARASCENTCSGCRSNVSKNGCSAGFRGCVNECMKLFHRN